MALPLSWRKAQRFASPMHSSATNCKSTYAGSYSSGALKQRRCVCIRMRSHHSAAHKHPALICLAVEVSRLSSLACSDLALPLQCMPLRSGHGAGFLQPWAPILRPLPLQRMPLRSGQCRVNIPWASSSAQYLCSACRFAAATVPGYTNLSLLQECSATHTAAIGGGALQNKGVAHPRPSSSAQWMSMECHKSRPGTINHSASAEGDTEQPPESSNLPVDALQNLAHIHSPVSPPLHARCLQPGSALCKV